MPIPGFSLVPPPETLSAAETVEMVIERFESSGCTKAEAGAWATDQVRKSKLKLLWTEYSPECLYGQPNGLYLAGNSSFDDANGGLIYLFSFPGARALDELDWAAGLLRRRVRWPKLVDREGKDIDTATLSDHERQRASADILWYESEHHSPRGATSALDAIEMTGREAWAPLREYFVKEWVIEELTYPFTIKRASLVAILDPVRVPLVEAAGIIANDLDVDIEKGLDTIIEAGATKRIKVYGTPEHKWQGDRIRARVLRKIVRGEARLSTEPSAGESASGSWSNPYVFRTDLERLLRELADDSGTGPDTRITQPGAGTARHDTQSEKAKLRWRIKKALESEAKKDAPRARTKAGWLELMRQEFGNDAVTDNLFDEAWQKADLPAAWRTAGRRT
jgi:hypothetical protein